MRSAPTTARNRTYGSARPHFWRFLHAEWLRISSLNHDVKPLGAHFCPEIRSFPAPLHATGRNHEGSRAFARNTQFHAMSRVGAVSLLIGRSRPGDSTPALDGGAGTAKAVPAVER